DGDMTSDKKDSGEIGDQLVIEIKEAKKKLNVIRDVVDDIIEIKEAKKKLNVIRDVVDDILEAAERGIKRLGGGEENE
ncbi:unnamed protein product, partial [marine sediment metagenome]